MSVKSKPYYWLECDDCGVKSTEHGEYTAWVSVEDARSEAEDWDGNWVSAPDDIDWCGTCRDKHVCRECDKPSDDLAPEDPENPEYWPMCPKCREES